MTNALRYTENMKKAGFSENQAIAVTQMLFEYTQKTCASKADLDLAMARVDHRFDLIEQRLGMFEQNTDQRHSSYESKIELRSTSFENKMEQKFTAFEEKMEQKFTAFEEKMEQKFAAFEEKMEQKFAAFEEKIQKEIIFKLGALMISGFAALGIWVSVLAYLYK